MRTLVEWLPSYISTRFTVEISGLVLGLQQHSSRENTASVQWLEQQTFVIQMMKV